jgi:hypothetical protein
MASRADKVGAIRTRSVPSGLEPMVAADAQRPRSAAQHRQRHALEPFCDLQDETLGRIWDGFGPTMREDKVGQNRQQRRRRRSSTPGGLRRL